MKMWPLDKTFTRWSMASLSLLAFLVGSLIISSVGADEELHQLGLDHLDVIGTRFIDEHHNIHDYPKSESSDESKPKLLSVSHDDSSDKSHEKSDKSKSNDKSDYHNPIYDHVHVDKTDYSDFGRKSSDGSDDKSH